MKIFGKELKFVEKNENIEKSTSIRGLEEEYQPNSVFGIEKSLFTKQKNSSVETLYNTIKASPEVFACVQAMVEDIMSDAWRFTGAKSAITKAKKFEIRSNFYNVLTSAIIDLIGTGDAYILKLSVNEESIKDLAVTLTKSLAEKFGVNVEKDTVFQLIESNEKTPRDLQLLKSSTVNINFNETGIIESYEQEVQGTTRIFKPKDVIHLSVMNIGGQPYGTTPLETLLPDVATLIFAKSYAGNFFENDGTPNWLFKMPDSNPDDRNYKLLKKELKEFKQSKNKQRNLVLTGNVEAEALNKFNKDMEYSKLIQHFTQLVVVAMGVPAYRINYNIQDNRQSGNEAGKIESGYYKRIAFFQKAIENQLNKYLWDLFNVEMTFKKSYKIDEMREAQIIQILSQSGAITLEEARERIGMDPEIPDGTPMSSIGDDKAINFNRDERAARGQEESNEPKQDNRVKTIDKSFIDAIEVDFSKFRIIVESKIGEGGFDKANLLYYDTDKYFVIFFNDGSWKYKTKVSKDGLDEEKFRVENLSFAVKIEL